MNRKALVCSVILCGMTFCFIYSFYQERVTSEDRPGVVCTTEDLTDTPFIQTVRQNETVVIPDKHVLHDLSREELAVLYHRYIENIQYLCKRRLRLGRIEDGGWDICDDDKYRPTNPCLVYSFGINNDFSFDDSVIKQYGCEVHSFDPSMGSRDYNRGTLNYFHALGLSHRDETMGEWKMLRFKSIRKQFNHEKTPMSILKMDIESWEWQVLPDIISTGDLAGIDNLVMELHLELSAPEQGRDKYLQGLEILKDLYDIGFRIFWTHQNLWCKFVSKCKQELRTNCHEVSFVKVR